MHASSKELMRHFIARLELPAGEVLDVGSADVNGTYRPLWEEAGWRYTGVDIAPGTNVDKIVPESGHWDLGRQFDVVVSGQCIEHCRRPWVLARTMGAHVRDGGWLCLIAPFAWPYHRHPIDCWRVAPDGMAVLFEEAQVQIIEAFIRDSSEGPRCIDCFAAGRKE